MRTHPSVMSTQPSRVDRAHLPHERRAETRFSPPGASVRLPCEAFEIDGASAEIAPEGLSGLWERLFSPRRQVLNLSKGGLSFETTRVIKRGTRVRLSLHVPGHAPIELSGQVRYCERVPHARYATVGVRFDPFGPGANRNPQAALLALRRLEAAYASSAT
jgi:hypothetical protein